MRRGKTVVTTMIQMLGKRRVTALSERINIENYCALFVDLLGQRNALSGQSLVPDTSSKEKKEEFLSIVKQSIGAIDSLHNSAYEFIDSDSGISTIRDMLSVPEQALYDEMKKSVPKYQRWSDGLVYFSSLETKTKKCPMNAVSKIFMLSGMLCFLGLASKYPIRGAIEIAWGVELHENELYGAVVANSYDLESKVAQYPRIVIGEKTIEYLKAFSQIEIDADDKLSLYNKNMARLCLSMTAIDQDGHHIVDYLGQSFTDSVTYSSNKELYKLAYRYIVDQHELHKNNKNTKLSMRYTWLRGYFHHNQERHA